MSVGPWQVVIVVLVVALLFGSNLASLGTRLGQATRALKKLSGGVAGAGENKNWVATAGEVTRMAKQVRKVTKVGRLIR